MKEQKASTQDIVEIRSMMEQSTKFLSLSGWAGIMAGLYALSGVYLITTIYDFNPDRILYSGNLQESELSSLPKVIVLGSAILLLALATAVFFSQKKGKVRGEKIWNATARRLIVQMAVPLLTGGILIVVFIAKSLIGLLAPTTLLFYGLALYNAGKFTINEVKILGFIQIGLGLVSSYFIEYSMILWALGFGVAHIFYGIYIWFRYER